MIGLGTLPWGDWSSATGVSDMGNLIVGNADSPEADFSTAFIWTPESGIRSLHDVLVNDLNVFTYGLELDYATGISGNGRFIIGHSFDDYSRSDIPWIVDLGETPPMIPPPRITPVPEASTYGFMAAALGAIVMAARMHRRRSVGLVARSE
jgi:hypothetical protein